MISLSELHISAHVLSQVFIYFIFYSWWWVWQQFNQNAIFFFLSLRGRHSGKGPAAVSNLLFFIYIWETKLPSSLSILKNLKNKIKKIQIFEHSDGVFFLLRHVIGGHQNLSYAGKTLTML